MISLIKPSAKDNKTQLSNQSNIMRIQGLQIILEKVFSLSYLLSLTVNILIKKIRKLSLTVKLI